MADDSTVNADDLDDKELEDALFGGTAEGGESDEGTDGDEPEGTDEDAEGEGDEEESLEDSFEKLSQSWQDEIKRLRKESGDRRTKIKQLEKQINGGEKQTPAAELEQAKNEGRAEAKQEYGAKLAGAEVRAALKGVVPDGRIKSLVARLNLTSLLDDEGEVDADAVADVRESVVALVGTRRSTTRSGNGRNTSTGAKSKTPADQFADAMTAAGF